jgi:hypothetical protein
VFLLCGNCVSAEFSQFPSNFSKKNKFDGFGTRRIFVKRQIFKQWLRIKQGRRGSNKKEGGQDHRQPIV